MKNYTTDVKAIQPRAQYCPAAGEYYVQLPDGTFIWAEQQRVCEYQAREALRVMADHQRRCPDDIPFMGEAGEYYETGTPQDLGLPQW